MKTFILLLLTILISSHLAAQCFTAQCSESSPDDPDNPASDGAITINLDASPPADPPLQVSWWLGAQMIGQGSFNCSDAFTLENLADGLYTVKIIDQSGCIYTCQVTVTRNEDSEACLCDYLDDMRCSIALSHYMNENMPTQNTCKQWLGPGECGSGSIFRYGRVAIGAKCVPQGYRLAITGGLITEYAQVELCKENGWCDYVFDEDYKLPSLKKVKKFVRRNKHLPGCIAQQDVTAANGYEVGQVKKFQQEKIEEIYLHLFDLRKRISELRQAVEALKSENQTLKSNALTYEK